MVDANEFYRKVDMNPKHYGKYGKGRGGMVVIPGVNGMIDRVEDTTPKHAKPDTYEGCFYVPGLPIRNVIRREQVTL